MADATILKRFLSKVKPATSGCWEWQGGKNEHGYGMFFLSPKARTQKAHRIAWEFFRGPIPDGGCVLHSCDNPPCVNPDHLWIGTKKQNSKDMVKKGRSTSGVKNSQSKITEDIVRIIRTDCRTYRKISAHYGICPSQVCEIKKGTAWKHVV